MQPDLNLRRQRLAARSSQMVTAKPLGQLKTARQFFFMYFPLTHSVSFFLYIYIYIFDKERRKRTTGERKKWPLQPSRESSPGPLAFSPISLPVKLLGQVQFQPNHGATLSLSSWKNETKKERMGCWGHFSLSPVVALFLLSVSKCLFSTHPEC